MNRYKIYFFDREIRQEYPVTVEKKNINDLCRFINSHIMTFNLEVVGAYLLDKYGGYIDEVEFLPCEIVAQFFITNYESRLIAYNEFIDGV